MEDGLPAAVEVSAPSRLHLSLLDLNGSLGRVDGGIGVALREPRLLLRATPSPSLSASGPGAGLVRGYAARFARLHALPPAHLSVVSSIPRHVGLGSGTQAALATGTALAALNGLELTCRDVARDLGRGGTSGIGVAAFEGGGFVVDGGHGFGPGAEKRRFLPSRASRASPPPVLARMRVPARWRFVVVFPAVGGPMHGSRERAAFGGRCPVPAGAVGSLCRLVLVKLLPSLVERDIARFGESLTSLAREGFGRVGADLVPSRSKALVKALLACGAAGAGVSSFGPAVYGLVEGEREASCLQDGILPLLVPGERALVTGADARGARISTTRPLRRPARAP